MTDSTATVTYTRPDGAPYSEKEQAQIAGYRDDLLSGVVFSRMAASQRSVYGYQPPMGSRTWARIMRNVADLAAKGDSLAQVAVGVRVNLYGTEAQAFAAVADALGKAVRDGYDDVLARTGPEPVRHSDAQRRFGIREVCEMAMCYYRAEWPGSFNKDAKLPVGWCLEAICRSVGVRTV